MLQVWRPEAYAFEMMSDVLHTTPHVWVAELTPYSAPAGHDSVYFAAAFVSADMRQFNVVCIARMRPTPPPSTMKMQSSARTRTLALQ